MYIIFFSVGAAAQHGLWPPHSWGFPWSHTTDTTQIVGLLWTSDQLVADMYINNDVQNLSTSSRVDLSLTGMNSDLPSKYAVKQMIWTLFSCHIRLTSDIYVPFTVMLSGKLIE